MKCVRDIPLLENVPVLVRAGLDVPIEQGNVVDDYRIRRTLPTIQFLAERRARVILIGHIGEQGTETLEPVARALGALLTPIPVAFSPETVGERARTLARDLAPGHVLVLENLRRNAGERANDPAFAAELASLADVFVQNAFDTCHRKHASLIGVPALLPSYAGLLLEEEVRVLSQALAPEHPALAIIGGAKFSTKEPVLMKLLTTYDHVFVGGALANDFLKASGQDVGKSLVSTDVDTAALQAIIANPRLVLPVDAVVIPEQDEQASDPRAHARVASRGMRPDEVGLDHGPGTRALLAELAAHAQTILWNGPLGNYERGFTDTTDAFARAVASSGAHSIVGGGDTLAAIDRLGLLPLFSFVSTGGGAMLEFLTHGTLPGIEALG